MTQKQTKIRRVHERIIRNQFREDAFGGKITVSELFKTDKELQMMRAGIPAGWLEVYKAGFDSYLEGNWDKAKESLEQAHQLKPDKTTKLLLAYMSSEDLKPPSDWQGHKFLHE